jgi:hypothetical protein
MRKQLVHGLKNYFSRSLQPILANRLDRRGEGCCFLVNLLDIKDMLTVALPVPPYINYVDLHKGIEYLYIYRLIFGLSIYVKLHTIRNCV